MEEIYRVRHIPTGYFIQPSNIGNRNSNIGKKGKLYEGNSIWAQIQSRSVYKVIMVNEGYGIYKDLAERFPDKIEKSWNYGKNCVKFYTNPEDFEKVYIQ